MRFLLPEFLWALSLLSVPILIHLFNFRRYKTLLFSDIRFLKEVKEETRKRSQLKHILILISRLLAITFLVLAFAQPYTPVNDQNVSEGNSTVSIYLDNSFSMEAEGSEGKLLETARQMIYEIAESYDETTQFQLLSNEFSGYQQRLVTREELFGLLDEVEISPLSRTLTEVYRRQAETLNGSNNSNQTAYIISDFQSKMFADDLPSDSISNVIPIHLKAEKKGNVYVDSVWFETPVRQMNGTEVMKIRMVNTSDESLEPSIVVEINNMRKKASAKILPQSTAIAQISYINTRAGYQEGEVTVDTENELQYDDKLYFSYTVLEKINVLEIGKDATSPFKTIYSSDNGFNYVYTDQAQVDLSDLGQQHMVVLNGLDRLSDGLCNELLDFVSAGGSLAIIPSSRIDLRSYQSGLSKIGVNSFASLDTVNQKVKEIDQDHIFFKEVFESVDPQMNLPYAYSHYKISGNYSSREESIFTFFDGSPFLSYYPIGSGSVYLTSVSLDPAFSNFRMHALFPTAALRMAELSFPSANLFYTIGGGQLPEIRDSKYNTEIPFELIMDEFKLIPIPDRSKSGRIGLITSSGSQDILSEDGIYTLSYDGNTIEKLAFNYDRNESERAFAETSDEIKAYYQNFNIGNLSVYSPKTISDIVEAIETAKPKSYWKICLILALIFLGVEIALIKVWRS